MCSAPRALVDAPLAALGVAEVLDRVGDVGELAIDAGLLERLVEHRGPAGPTNGWPSRSSRSPGCSPTSIASASRESLAEDGLRRALVELARAAAPGPPRAGRLRRLVTPRRLPTFARRSQPRLVAGHRDARLHQLDDVVVGVGHERALTPSPRAMISPPGRTPCAAARSSGRVEVVDHEREVVAVADRDLRRGRRADASPARDRVRSRRSGGSGGARRPSATRRACRRWAAAGFFQPERAGVEAHRARDVRHSRPP